MTLVQGFQKALSQRAIGSFGFGGFYGRVWFGKGQYGSQNQYAGIYHKKRTARGWGISLMHYYAPTNPRTVPQQARRSIFAEGVIQWQSLTAPEKASYNDRARGERLTGFQLFQREYLRSH